MSTEVHVFAPAKINLNLRVLPKREDGFHSIESIFQAVNLKDELIISVCEGTGKCDVFCKAMTLPQKNTITLAYEAFNRVTGKIWPSVHVELIKHIPAGGGLGGGSSDSAAFIKALQKIFDVSLSQKQLDEIAGFVGSDVFFFFHCDEEGNGAALVSGRGEIVKEIECRKDLHILLVLPDVHSSTKEAYSLVDDWLKKDQVFEYPALKELEHVYNSSVKYWSFVNTFTVPLTERYPLIGEALKCVRQSGALYSEMSGSGSTVFGIYASEEDVLKAEELLYRKGFSCAVA